MRTSRIVSFWPTAVIAAVALAITSAWAYYVMFSGFSWYDDEGYVMITVRQFLEGRALYDDVYSQYGPFYYVVRLGLLTALQAPVSHDVTRLLALATWVATAALIAVFLWQTTRSGMAALIGYFLTFQHLRPTADEPGHPQELCLLLLAALVALAARWNTRPSAPSLMIASGIIVSGLTLTKVNVGVYALLGVAMAIATFASHARTTYLFLVSVAGAVLPWAVMRTHSDWSSEYAAVISLSFLAAAAACHVASADRPLGGKAILRFVVAGAATAIATCLAILARGTSAAGLVNGVLIQPLGFAEIFFNELRFPLKAVVIAAGSLMLAWRYRSMPRTSLGEPHLLQWTFWWLKMAGGVFGILLAVVAPAVMVSLAPALLWLVLIRPLGEPWPYERFLPRVVLVSVAILQTLQAYPVAGSQVAWATFLAIPAILLCVADATAELAATRPGQMLRTRFSNRHWLDAVALGAIVVFFAARLDVVAARERYRALTPLSLPGSLRIRLPGEEAALYQWLAAQAAQRCTTVITLPGLNSLYFWSDLEPPTGINATAWPALLDRQQQQRIVDAVRSRPNVCVFEYASGVRTFGRDAIVYQQPLMRFVRGEFHVVEERGRYRILRRDRSVGGQP